MSSVETFKRASKPDDPEAARAFERMALLDFGVEGYLVAYEVLPSQDLLDEVNERHGLDLKLPEPQPISAHTKAA